MYCESLNPACFIKYTQFKFGIFILISLSPIVIEIIYAHNEFQNLLHKFNEKNKY